MNSTRPTCRASLLPATSFMFMTWSIMFQWPVSRLARARLSLLWLKKNALPATFLSRQARTSATSSPPQTGQKKALEEGDISLQMRVTQPIEEDVWLEVRGGKITVSSVAQNAMFALARWSPSCSNPPWQPMSKDQYPDRRYLSKIGGIRWKKRTLSAPVARWAVN